MLTVIHPLFGEIRLNEKYAKVLELPPFRELAFKSQLGNKTFSKSKLNAKHTRLMHSIGVMHLTSKLIAVCEKKFHQYFTITQTEKETLELAALGHDLGHIAFSHSLEGEGMRSHEERTVELFEKYAEEINSIFGYDIVSGVLSIYRSNEMAKKQGIGTNNIDTLNILFVFTNLLIGAIDCDRMEYLMTDRYMVFGQKQDFTSIFDYITIVLLNDVPTIGFEKGALQTIENMLLARFDQYLSIYYEVEDELYEMALRLYVKEANWPAEYRESVMEFEVLAHMYQTLRRGEKGTKSYRYAQIIFEGHDQNLLYRTFKDRKEYEHFMQRLYSVTSSRDSIYTYTKKATLYNPKKNKVYIKCDDGIVREITEVSAKIRDYSVETFYLMVDVDQVYGLSEEEVKNIRALFENNDVEIEKKFEFSQALQASISKGVQLEECANVQHILEQLNGVQILQPWQEVQNVDTYFDSITLLPQKVAMRHRKTISGEEGYYIKIPVSDGTNITKREEYPYKCETFSEFLSLATSLFKAKYNLQEALEVEQGLTINTIRYKITITVQQSIIEIACDFSTYEYKGEVATDRMLECELKEGDDLSLWYLANHLKKFGFKEINQSKQTRGKLALQIK